MVQVDKSAQPGLFSIWIFPYLNIFLKAWPLTIDQIDNKQLKYMCKFPQTIFFSTIVCCAKWWNINQWNLSIVSSSFCRFWFFSCCLCLPAMHQQWLDCNKSMPELSDVRSMKLGDWAVWVWTQVRRYYPTTDRDTQYTFWICRHILRLRTEMSVESDILITTYFACVKLIQNARLPLWRIICANFFWLPPSKMVDKGCEVCNEFLVLGILKIVPH